MGYLFIFFPLSGFDRTQLYDALKDHSAVLIFLTPVFGYLASTVHHILYNFIPYYRINLKEYRVAKESYFQLWTIFNLRWRKNSGKLFYADFDARNNVLTDLMHGNGSILVACILNLLILILLRLSKGFPSFCVDDWWLFGPLLAVLAVHCLSYFISRKHAQYFVKNAIEELKTSPKKV